MACQLLKDDGSYDRAARQSRAATGATHRPGIGPRSLPRLCVGQARALRAEFLGRSLAPVRRKAARLKTPLRRKSLTKAESARGSRIEN